MGQDESTEGSTLIGLKPETELERTLRQFIEGHGRAPAGHNIVVGADLLREARNEIRRLRAKLLDHGIDA